MPIKDINFPRISAGTTDRIMKKTVYILAAAAVLALACQKEKADPEISFNPESAEFESSGGSLLVGVKSGLDWKASTSDTWISIQMTEGYGSDSWEYMKLTVGENAGDPRKGTVTVSNGSRSKDLKVVQGTIPTDISADKSELSFTSVGGNASVALTTLRAWTATASESWLTISPASGEGSSAAVNVTVSAETNEGEARTATITFSNGKSEAKVSVSQSKDAMILMNKAEFLAWFNEAATYGEGTQVSLGADIDLARETLSPIPALKCSINGKGHKIMNWKTTTSLIDTLRAGTTVKNLVIDSSCSLTLPTGFKTFGFLVANNHGTVSEIVNNASVSIPSIPAFGDGAYGAIVGYTYEGGSVSGCENHGDITYSGPGYTTGTVYFGGVQGRMTAASTTISESKNYGKITFTFSDATTTSGLYIGGVTGSANANSNVLSCRNYGDITVRTKGFNGNHLIGGVVAYAASETKDCHNEGNISLFSETAEGAADGPVKGAGVAGISAYQGKNGGTLEGCSNKGAITLRAGYSLGFTTVGSMTKFASAVGGIVAYSFKNALKSCTNSGAISSHFGNIDNSASNYNTTVRQCIGGIIASTYGNVEECTNTGAVTANWVTSTHNAALAKNFVTMAGGISGGDYHSDQVGSSIINCTNEGAVNYTCDSSGSNNAVGGIVGWPSKENAAVTSSISGCVNRGAVTHDGFAKSRVGGIVGAGGGIDNCKNFGKVYFKSGHASSAVGGLAGYRNFLFTTNSENHGDVVSDVKLVGGGGGAGAIGGLAGGSGNTVQTIAGCLVDCTVSAPEGCNFASMVIGNMDQNKATGQTVSVGTEASPIRVKGTFCGTKLTSSNYTDFIKWAGMTTDYGKLTWHVVYAE